MNARTRPFATALEHETSRAAWAALAFGADQCARDETLREDGDDGARCDVCGGEADGDDGLCCYCAADLEMLSEADYYCEKDDR